jgi:hypothetical protein
MGMLIGRIIIQKSNTEFDEVATAFDTTFGFTGITDHVELANLQGGTSGEYYHLTSSEHAELNAWLDDVTLSDGGAMTLGGNLIIPDAGNIGSVSDTDAIAIAADGKTTFTQDLTVNEDIIIGDAKYIGSASDPDAIAIAADGKTTFTQDMTVNEDIIIGDGKYIGSSSDPDAMSIAAGGAVTLTQDLGVGAASGGDRVQVTDAGDAALLIKATTDGSGYARLKCSTPTAGAVNVPADAIALLRLENNLTDDAGTYVWSDTSVVAFSDSIYDEGLYSAAFDATDTDELISSDSAITETVKSVEFQLRYTANAGVDYVYWAGADATYVIRLFDAKIWQYVGGGWTPDGYSLSVDTWYNIGVNFDGTDVKLYVDGTERLSTTNSTQPANKSHYWGASPTAVNFVLDGYLDMLSINDDTRTFPTTYTYVETFPVKVWYGFDETNDRAEINADDFDLKIDVGASEVNIVALQLDVDCDISTSTGSKIGTATDQKLGFFNATPVVQQTYTAVSNPPTQTEVTAIRDAIINLGFMAAS